MRLGSTPAFVSVSSAMRPVFADGVRVHHHRHARLDRCRGGRLEDARHIADQPVRLQAALEKRRLDSGVVDPDLDLTDEDLRDRLGRPVAEEVRQLEERVDARGDDDVEIDLGVDALDPVNVATEPGGGRVDERRDPRLADGAQLLDRVGDAHLLVPVALAPQVCVVEIRLGLHHEDVLVHQRGAELGGVDRATDCLDGAHGSLRLLSGSSGMSIAGASRYEGSGDALTHRPPTPVQRPTSTSSRRGSSGRRRRGSRRR